MPFELKQINQQISSEKAELKAFMEQMMETFKSQIEDIKSQQQKIENVIREEFAETLKAERESCEKQFSEIKKQLKENRGFEYEIERTISN